MLAQARLSPSLFVILFGLIGLAQGFWRMECRSRSGLARVDPLISYGEVSSHAHVVHGSGGFSETSVYSDLMASNCTSCSVSQDKSAYWTPALYFQHADTGEFELVEQVGGMLAYYLLYPNADNTSLSAFPEGFQMIAGSSNKRNFSGPVPDPPKSDWTASETTQYSLAEKALGFNCLNYNKAAEGSLYRHFLPDKAYLDANCTDGVRFELMFPSCWNGVDLDSDDHKSHVAYPDEVMTGNCPEGFDTRLVSLFYETIWNTYAFYGVDGQFVIANGDPTGYGYHGDFIMGWDGSFLQDAVDTCTDASGEIEDCPLFTIQDAETYDACQFTVPEALSSDNYTGPMTTLPGNVAIQSGPAPATDGSTAGSTDNNPTATSGGVVPTLGYSSGQSIATSGTYTPGGVFIESTSTAAEAASSSAYATPTSSTIVAAAAAAVTESETPFTTSAILTPVTTYYSTQLITTGSEVEEILWVIETAYVTATEVVMLTAVPTTVVVKPRSEEHQEEERTAAAAAARHEHAHVHRHAQAHRRHRGEQHF